MRIFDLTHAYQPFQPPDFVPPWVEKNLTEIFLPLSRAMKEGVIRRGLQLQGWTIEVWQKAAGPIRKPALETLENLREAARRGNIELGASGYAHPILPLLNDEVIKRQIEEDLAVVRKHLGEPVWFWFPEGAVDERSLAALHEVAPDLIAVIPDRCLGRERFSGFAKVEFEDGSYQRVAVCNVLLKDVFANAEDYKTKPEYMPENLDWGVALQATYSGTAFNKILEVLSSSENVVFARDLENAGNKYGLFELERGVKEVKGLKESGLDFALPSQIDWESVPSMRIFDIRASSWEPLADGGEPYPYWILACPGAFCPTEALRKIIRTWVEFIQAFNRSYRPDFPKESLIVLASDVPWHFLGKPEWHPNPRHPAEFTRKAILPIVKELGIPDLVKAAEELLKTVDAFIKENDA